MNANQYRAHLAKGIPAGNLTAANMITVAGVNGSGKRFQGRQAYDEGRAAYAVNMSLASSATHPYKRKNNPYSKMIGQQYYNAGLSDGEDFDSVTAGAAFTPGYTAPPVAADAPINFGNQSQNYIVSSTPTLAPQPTAGSSSDWAGVLNSASSKSLFGSIGSGLATLIGGRANASLIPLPTSTGPSLTTMLLVGGALAIPLFLVFRKKTA